jgi:hypothetical protein
MKNCNVINITQPLCVSLWVLLPAPWPLSHVCPHQEQESQSTTVDTSLLVLLIYPKAVSLRVCSLPSGAGFLASESAKAPSLYLDRQPQEWRYCVLYVPRGSRLEWGVLSGSLCSSARLSKNLVSDKTMVVTSADWLLFYPCLGSEHG